jgi:deazaflavin-dependent oxidoreductase (nitroreductase family)
MTEPNYTRPDVSLLGDDHIRAYRETGGEVGYLWNGVPTLLLTVTGRRTGSPRTSALIFGRDCDDYLVVASRGGAAQHPLWYVNLQAQPQATVEVKAERFTVVAQTASAEQKPRLWAIMAELWPNYDVYQSRTQRDIPVVVLSPI